MALVQCFTSELYAAKIVVNAPAFYERSLVTKHQTVKDGRQTSSQTLSDKLPEAMNQTNRSVVLDDRRVALQ